MIRLIIATCLNMLPVDQPLAQGQSAAALEKNDVGISTETLKGFLAAPKTAIRLKATVWALETLTVRGTNALSPDTKYVEQGSRQIECHWTPTLFAYSEDFDLPGRIKRTVNVVRDGNLFITRTTTFSPDGSPQGSSAMSWEGEWNDQVDLQNPVAASYKRSRDYFGTIMNLGVPDVELGGVQWQGERVSAAGRTTSQSFVFGGTLAVGERGEPVRLDLKRTSPNGFLYYRIQYGENERVDVLNTAFKQMPAQWDAYRFTGEQTPEANTPVQTVLVTEMAFVTTEEVRSELDRLRRMASELTNQYVVKGNQLYVRLSDNMLIPYSKIESTPPFRISVEKGRAVFLGGTVIFTAGFLLFLGRGGRKCVSN